MPENGFVMRFFGCARRSVGVVGVQRSIQLSYDRTSMKIVAGANSFDEMQRPGVKGPCAARNLFSIAHPPGKCNPRRGFGA